MEFMIRHVGEAHMTDMKHAREHMMLKQLPDAQMHVRALMLLALGW